MYYFSLHSARLDTLTWVRGAEVTLWLKYFHSNADSSAVLKHSQRQVDLFKVFIHVVEHCNPVSSALIQYQVKYPQPAVCLQSCWLPRGLAFVNTNTFTRTHVQLHCENTRISHYRSLYLALGITGLTGGHKHSEQQRMD